MYINGFWIGMAATLLMEFAAIVIFVVAYVIRSRRKKHYGKNMEHKKD